MKQHATAAGESRTIPDPAELAMIQAAERKSIEASVLALLPVANETYPQIAVTSYHPATVPKPADPRMRDVVLEWLGPHAGTLSPGRDCAGRLVVVALRGPIGQPGAAPGASPELDLPSAQLALVAEDRTDAYAELPPRESPKRRGRDPSLARRIVRRRSQRSRSSGQRVAHLDWKRELRR